VRLLSFILAEKEYGVGIENVREVRRIKAVTPIPQALHFIEGVVSLRGRVVPIISLRKKLGLPAAKDAAFKRVLIIETGKHVLGIVVDDIVGVITLDAQSVEQPDEILNRAEYLVGVGKADRRLILIVDIEKLLSGEERGGIDEVHKKVELRKKT
jgi:purine-binding chemotaxis protein CheW